jgi:tetratricopeptide (TPR) repeat protein
VDELAAGAAEVRSLADLASLLRRLRQRQARVAGADRVSYRALAKLAGWSHAIVGGYLSGTSLAPADRFDVLIRLLGATPAEQRALATARDQVEELRRGSAPPPQNQGVVPRQLPADVAGFTGRQDELAELDALAATPAGERTAVVISSVAGTAGVGKTALVVHWAHRWRGRFPDGQVYVDLRGYDPAAPLAAHDALAGLLEALGVTGANLPAGIDERAARWRSETADRQLLIVLDNAASVEQVRPLLPGTPSCHVLVTSRDSLAGLVVRHGARRLDLDLLPESDAYELLAGLIGPRVAAEPDAARLLVRRCARLPLALRVAAELAVARASTPLAELVAELGDEHLFGDGGDPRADVRAVFSWSVRHLPPEAARVFGLLGWHPHTDFDVYAVAALVGSDVAAARSAVELLARQHLVQVRDGGRYGMHDLLRVYARGLAGGDSEAALGRLFDHYLATAATAMDTLHPAEAFRRPRIARPGTPAPDLADPDAARRWLDTELACLTSIARHGSPSHAVRLSSTLFRYLDGGHHDVGLAMHGYALDAAVHSGDEAGQAEALNGLGTVHMRLGGHAEAVDHLQRALELFRQVDDRVGEARALGNLGVVEASRGHFRRAVEHQEQVLILYRRAGDDVGEARALINLGDDEQRLGWHDRAAEHIGLALDIFRKVGDRDGEAFAVNNLGIVEMRRGNLDTAAAHHRAALAAFREVGGRVGEAWALEGLGDVELRLARQERATECHQEALAVFRDIGDQDGVPWALNGLGETALAEGRPAAALDRHTDALAVAVECGARDQQARAHTGLGLAHRDLGDPERAREHLTTALATYDEFGLPEADEVRAHLAAL